MKIRFKKSKTTVAPSVTHADDNAAAKLAAEIVSENATTFAARKELLKWRKQQTTTNALGERRFVASDAQINGKLGSVLRNARNAQAPVRLEEEAKYAGMTKQDINTALKDQASLRLSRRYGTPHHVEIPRPAIRGERAIELSPADRRALRRKAKAIDIKAVRKAEKQRKAENAARAARRVRRLTAKDYLASVVTFVRAIGTEIKDTTFCDKVEARVGF